MRNFKGIHDTCDRLLLSHPAHVYGSTGAGSTPKDSLQYRILEEFVEHEVLRCTPHQRQWGEVAPNGNLC